MDEAEAAQARAWMAQWQIEIETPSAPEGDRVNTSAEEREREYAARCLTLALGSGAPRDCHDSSPITDADCKLAIAMLIKRPALAPLPTFVSHHALLGVTRFDFFFDDAEAGEDTAAAANEPAVALLRDAASRWPGCAGVDIIVHRCTVAWWRDVAQPASRVWDAMGPFLWSDVIARQVLAVEVAVSHALDAGARWLIHIDPDEALCFGSGAAAAGIGASAAAAGTAAPCAGAAVRWFSALPHSLDEVVFLNHEVRAAAQVTARTLVSTLLFVSSNSSEPIALRAINTITYAH